MDSKTMKNIIILKDLPSNMVEEAFVIFKDNVKIHKTQKVEKNKIPQKEEKPKNKEYMVKEAEMIISDYISKIEKKEYEITNSNKTLNKKYKRLKAITIFLAMFSTLSLYLILLK